MEAIAHITEITDKNTKAVTTKAETLQERNLM